MAVMFFEDMSLTVRSEQFDGGKKVTLHAYATSDMPAADVLRAVLSYLDAGLLNQLEDQ